MACRKTKKTAFFLIFTICIITACLAGCSSGKTAPVQELPAIEEPAPEPTLAELVAALGDAWASEQATALPAAPDTPLFSAPRALPAGDRLARKYETALGGFLADAERGFLADYGIVTDFAFINAELIRAGLPEGPVTKADIQRVLPFGQTVCIAELSGEQLNNLFAQIGALPQGAGGFAQVSDGVSYTLSFDETGFSPALSAVLVGGEPVDAERMYRVALNDFVAAGGNGYSFFLQPDVVTADTHILLADAIADYCSKHGDSLYMKQGERITIFGGITE